MDDLPDRLNASLGHRYRIVRELGRGGMGVVYLADDLKLGRPVALKVLRPEIAQSLGAERFLREIRIIARLHHHNILSLIDSGEVRGLLYYVMFFVDGESLRERLDREGPLPVDEAVEIAVQAAQALEHAHGERVVHRDVKPENIMIEAGHVLVCDFGVARAVGEAGGDKLTHTGLTIGTPAYMSPEQALGTDEVDRRVDIYGLGCVLYEMLTGAPPFAGTSTQALLARKAVEPVSHPRVVRDTVPLHVDEAVVKALARIPTDRFRSAADFARALAEPEFAAQATRRPHGWARRSFRVAGAVAGIAVSAMALLLLGRSEPPDALVTTFAQVTALPGLESSPSLSPDGVWVVYSGEDGPDRDIFLRRRSGERTINLTPESSADDYDPALSPDGERIAFRSSRDGGGIYVMDATGEAVRRVTDVGYSPAWSPDGRRLAYVLEYVDVTPLNLESDQHGLWTVGLDGGASRQLVSTDAVLPSWSPDGRWIAYTGRSAGSHLWLVSSEGGEPTQLTRGTAHDWAPAWAPDGRMLYFSSDRGGSMNLWRIQIDESNGRVLGPAEPVTTPSQFVAHPTVSADGSTVVYTSVLTTQNIERATLDARAGTLGDPFLVTTGSRQWSSPDPSPDGSMAAFYSRDLPEGDLYVVRRDGSGLRQVTGDSAVDRMPRWSPDGSRLAYFSNRSGELQTWWVGADGSGNERLTFGEGAAVGGWSPDGSLMMINAFPEGGFLLDPTLARDDPSVRRLSPDSTWGRFVANDWSRDGSRLAAMFGYTDTGVGYYDLETGRHVQVTDFGQWPVWLPDSRTLLFVSGGRAFYLVDVESGEAREVYSTVRDVLGPPRVSADGTEVWYSRRTTEGDLWAVTIEER